MTRDHAPRTTTPNVYRPGWRKAVVVGVASAALAATGCSANQGPDGGSTPTTTAVAPPHCFNGHKVGFTSFFLFSKREDVAVFAKSDPTALGGFLDQVRQGVAEVHIPVSDLELRIQGNVVPQPGESKGAAMQEATLVQNAALRALKESYQEQQKADPKFVEALPALAGPIDMQGQSYPAGVAIGMVDTRQSC